MCYADFAARCCPMLPCGWGWVNSSYSYICFCSLAIKAGPATAAEMMHWSVTLGVLAASQILGILL